MKKQIGISWKNRRTYCKRETGKFLMFLCKKRANKSNRTKKKEENKREHGNQANSKTNFRVYVSTVVDRLYFFTRSVHLLGHFEQIGPSYFFFFFLPVKGFIVMKNQSTIEENSVRGKMPIVVVLSMLLVRVSLKYAPQGGHF